MQKANPSDPNSFESIISFARALRLKPTLSKKEEEIRQQALLTQACTLLPHYSSKNGLTDSLEGFLQDVFGEKLTAFKIKIRKNRIREKEDNVFLLLNGEKELCYVAKAFYQPQDLSSNFMCEISSLDLLGQLLLPHVCPILPISFAICHSQGTEWGVVLQTAAKGQRLDQYIFDISRFPLGSLERLEHLENARKAIERMGASLGYLHSSPSPFYAGIPEHRYHKFQRKLDAVLNNPFIVKMLEIEVSLEKFHAYIKRVLHDVATVQARYSYCHGDAHLGNMFYDETKEQFCFIDLCKMHRSVCYSGNALLDGCVDLIRVEENLYRKSATLLTDAEIHFLITSLHEKYVLVLGEMPDHRLMAFYRTRIKLGRLLSYYNFKTQKDLSTRQQEKAIFEDAIAYFKNQK